ncbi:MAG: sigma-54-dependent Fis family transcriptional regulator [Planctomycetota bacterium]|nr:MAG: sigma-54-dependent Fis family transcriptional regulator [Planctomycetota bacterium]
MVDPEREITWLRRVRDLSHLLVAERDVSRLLPLILDAAIELTEAERGFLVRVLGRKPSGGFRFKVEVARGFDKAALQGGQSKVSRTVVRRVCEQGRGLVTTSEEDRDVLEISSVQARRVLSIVCVPMRLRGEIRGVLYLDHRFSKGAFSQSDLEILATFADQAALAMETAELLAGAPQADRASAASLRELEELKAQRAAQEEAAAAVREPAPRRRLRFGRLVGSSPLMCKLYEQIERAARTWDPVLVIGESGTGKELVAREIHARGSFPTEPFLSENCAAVAESLLESELFGHRKGAFTGAVADRDGLFVEAGRGTLFLDEVGDMSPAMQGKLLRVLQEQVVRPVGATASRPIACRVLAATHRDLREMIRSGSFREDLYYRLDVLRIFVPPLRQRPSDILPLFETFCEQAGRPGLKLTSRAQKLLVGYSWPGNVRELENEAKRLAALGLQRVSAQQLSPEIREGRGVARARGELSGKTLGEVEREMVLAAMAECQNNKSRAARQLGIPRTTLYHLLERYGIA